MNPKIRANSSSAVLSRYRPHIAIAPPPSYGSAMNSDLCELLEGARHAAQTAAQAILEIYHTPFEVRSKADASPVTEADERAETIIIAALAKLAPEIPVVAEEMAARGEAVAAKRFWLVDPLDGTREFVAKNGEFTTNIGLIEGDRPVLG